MFGLVIIVTVVHLSTASAFTWESAFLVAWTLLAVVGLYWYVFRVAYELRFDGEALYWRSPLRSGRFALQDLSNVRLRWGTDGIIERTDGSRLHVMAQKGFARFASGLSAANPRIEVRIGVLGRLYQWMPGPNRFRS